MESPIKTAGTLKALCIGKIIIEGDEHAIDPLQKKWVTGFYKRPVADRRFLFHLGVEGDDIADKKHHGGKDKAVFANSAEHYPIWERFLNTPLRFGDLSENLTIEGFTEDNVSIGERHRIGEAILEVSQPRKPCWKISRRFKHKTFAKEILTTGTTGWYYRVIQEGTVGAGDKITRLSTPNPELSIKHLNDLLYGRILDRSLHDKALASPLLADAFKDALVKGVVNRVFGEH